jgi:hypothetical protein
LNLSPPATRQSLQLASTKIPEEAVIYGN